MGENGCPTDVRKVSALWCFLAGIYVFVLCGFMVEYPCVSLHNIECYFISSSLHSQDRIVYILSGVTRSVFCRSSYIREL